MTTMRGFFSSGPVCSTPSAHLKITALDITTLLKRVTSFLEENNILALTQFGFRKAYSTTHSVLDIVTESYDSMNDK